MVPSQESALLLTGGGARAAYQVGVLKGIASLAPPTHPIPFRILCGTSAGAINVAGLASYASNFHLGVKNLELIWSNFATHHVYQSSRFELYGHLLSRIGRLFQSDSSQRPAASLFNNQPLRELLNEVISFERINRHIHKGYLRAVAITASSYNSGDSVSFYEGVKQHKNWQRAKRRGCRTRLNTEHLMASAAIPLVFPAIQVQQEFYGDGSVHQIAPLSPAVHLGASKILVISLTQADNKQEHKPPLGPSSATIVGHLLDTIFADTLNSDLERLNRVNNTIDQLEAAHIPHPSLRRIQSILIQPKHDFNEIAHQHFHRLPKPVRRVLSLFGVHRDTPSSIVSYLLFEKEYCRELIQLGYEDAHQQAESLHTFLELGGTPIE